MMKNNFRRIRAAIPAFFLVVLAVSGVSATAVAAGPVATADVELWRIDCGDFVNFDISGMSDIFAYQGRKKTLTNSCYLIRHAGQYMLWDTGFPLALVGKFGLVARARLTEQLGRLSIRPDQISIVGISHFHFDHTGQAADFPKAHLLIGKGDWDTLSQSNPAAMPDTLAPWLRGANVEPTTGDKDVFGDGSVVMLRTPGHTAGHHALLVRLPKSGAVILAGDLWHISEQVRDSAVSSDPMDTLDRADLFASRDRVLKLAARLHAKLIIQHEPADIAKLPLFPASAR